MQGILKGTKQEFKKTLAWSFILHILVISLGLALFNAGTNRTFFNPVYTVDLVATGPVKQANGAGKPVEKPVEKPATSPQEPAKKERVQIKEPAKPKQTAIAIKPKALSLDEAVKKIAEEVKKKDERTLVDSRIEELKKKREAESKYVSSRIAELKKEISSARPQEKPSKEAAARQTGSSGAVTRENLEAKYPAYFSIMHDRVQDQWSIYSEDLKDSKLSIIVSVKIDRSGKLLETHVEKSSGDAHFDESLIKAIRKAEFPPLPQDFEGSFLETGFRFCPNCER
ncbi:MAG: TonB family protein [Deltaproteobacteria bacterium]|nr:TonB family protein [Deltaproteobacteria bacterium]